MPFPYRAAKVLSVLVVVLSVVALISAFWH